MRTNRIRWLAKGHGRLCFVRRFWATGGYPKIAMGAGERARNFLEISRRSDSTKKKGKLPEDVTGQAGQTACEMQSRGPGLADGR